MSKQRTFYVIDTPLNDQVGTVAYLEWAGVLVPVTVDDFDIEAARKAAFPFMLSPKHCEQILRAALGGADGR